MMHDFHLLFCVLIALVVSFRLVGFEWLRVPNTLTYIHMLYNNTTHYIALYAQYCKFDALALHKIPFPVLV